MKTETLTMLVVEGSAGLATARISKTYSDHDAETAIIEFEVDGRAVGTIFVPVASVLAVAESLGAAAECLTIARVEL